MKRGDLVTIAVAGDYGKPRPALVIQSDAFALHPSVTILLLTGEIHDAPLLRILVEPGTDTGLRKPSQIMVDKAMTVPRGKVGITIGRVPPATLTKVSQALAAFLELP